MVVAVAAESLASGRRPSARLSLLSGEHDLRQLDLFALGHVLVGEHDEARVGEGLLGSGDEQRAAHHPLSLVQLGLRLHVEAFQLGEDLLRD